MHNTFDVYAAYKRARAIFVLKTYLLLLLWLVLAFIQWLLISLLQPIRQIFMKHYYISVVAFILAVFLFALFIFIEALRRILVLAFIMSFLIAELQIIALFTLVAHTHFFEMILWFFICAVLVFIFAGIGMILPRVIDLTLHVALLFITSFVFLLVTVYFLTWHLLLYRYVHYIAYVFMQLSITFTILSFVMYHSQTIHGRRFAEMRLHDFFLASIILFHDFLIIFWLTFYWQIVYRLITPDDYPYFGPICRPNKYFLQQQQQQQATTTTPAGTTEEDTNRNVSVKHFHDDHQYFYHVPKEWFKNNALKNLSDKITSDYNRHDDAASQAKVTLYRQRQPWQDVLVAQESNNAGYGNPESDKIVYGDINQDAAYTEEHPSDFKVDKPPPLT